MRKYLFLFVATAVFLFSGFSLAENADEEKRLDEVVVTATRYNEESRHVPAYVSIITEADIKNSGAQNIPELLRNQAGVKVNDITGSRRTYTVDLRGFGETATMNTLVLVDGRRVNQADLSGTDWAQIPLDRVEKIEIIRGGRGSILYGDNAAGGVINIITKTGDQFKAGLSGAVGSYEAYNGSVYASGSLADLSYSLSAGYLNTGGYRDNSDQEANDFGANLNYSVSNFLKLNFSSGYHKDETGLPGALKESDFAAGASRTDSINPDDFSETEDYYFKVAPDLFFLDDDLFKIDLAYRNRDVSSFASFVGGNFTADTEIETISVSPRLVLKNDFGFLANDFSLGFDYEHINEDITNDLVFPPFSSLAKFRLKRKNYGYYFYDVIKPLSCLSFSFGYRYDRAYFDFDSYVAPSETFSIDENAYTAGVNYLFADRSFAYFSFARSFRYPVLDEYFDFTSNTVNSDLKPQKSNDLELGVRYFFSDDTFINLNLFHLETTDEIFLNPSPQGFGIVGNDNLDGDTLRDGIEFEFQFVATEWLRLNGNYAYTHAKIRNGQFKDKYIPDVPQHMATMGALFSWKGASLALNGIYVGERPFVSDFGNNFSQQDDYLVFNVRLKYTWEIVTVFLDLNNITNEKYSEFGVLSLFSSPRQIAYYPSPRANVLFGMSVDF